MPKRITLPPLGEHDDDWLRIWAWLNNRSKSSQAAGIVSFRIRERKAEIREMLEYIAQKRGVTPDYLFKSILDGNVDNNTDESAIDE